MERRQRILAIAESVLRETNRRFKEWLGYLEQGAKKQGRDLSTLSLDEMESLWQEAKKSSVELH